MLAGSSGLRESDSLIFDKITKEFLNNLASIVIDRKDYEKSLKNHLNRDKTYLKQSEKK